MMVSIALGLLGALSLAGVYKALEMRWPEAYESLNDSFALDVVRTWWRLAAFRVLPVLTVGLAVSVTTMRLHGSAARAIGIMVGIHAAATNGTAMAQAFSRNNSREFRVNHGSYHLSALALLIVTGTAVGFLTPSLEVIVPMPSVLLDSLWTALFVAVAAGALLALVGKPNRRGFTTDEDYYVWRATRDVGQQNIDLAFEAALRYGADPILLRAIMFTEALQRPRWVRNVERLGGRLFGRGSYGVTQVKTERPISDSEALYTTASWLSGKWGLRREEYGWTVDDGAIWKAVGSYNGERAFIDAVQRLYRNIYYSFRGEGSVDADELMIRPLEVRRYSESFGFRCVINASELELTVTLSDSSVQTVAKGGLAHGLHACEILIPPDAVFLEARLRSDYGNWVMTTISLASPRITQTT